jgi:hypothetical protein
VKDQYVGDVGDYGKYALLRALTRPDENAEPDLSLGVVWYLTPDDDTGHGQGRARAYVSTRYDARFRGCDESLRDALKRLNDARAFRLAAVREFALLPAGTVEHLPPVPDGGGPSGGVERRVWHRGALDTTGGCDIVFLDPDNGIELTRYAAKSSHAALDEVADYCVRDQTAVVWQHPHKLTSHAAQAGALRSALDRRLRSGRSIHVVRFVPWYPRFFVIVPADRHRERLEERVRALVHVWSPEFGLDE